MSPDQGRPVHVLNEVNGPLTSIEKEYYSKDFIRNKKSLSSIIGSSSIVIENWLPFSQSIKDTTKMTNIVPTVLNDTLLSELDSNI